jgi:hypothetical protein
VQPFVIGQDPTAACSVLQRISGRRVVTLEPWLHAGSTLQHVFWSSCDGSDVAVILVRRERCTCSPNGGTDKEVGAIVSGAPLMQVADSVLDTDSYMLPSWKVTEGLLTKLNSPVLLCTSPEDTINDIAHAAAALPPSLLLHTPAEHHYDSPVSATAALKATREVYPSCRLLGALPEVSAVLCPDSMPGTREHVDHIARSLQVAFLAAVQTLQSAQPSAEPLRALVADAIKSRVLLEVMARANPQAQIPRPALPPAHHKRSSIACRSLCNRVRIAVGLDMGHTGSQFQGNLSVLESWGCAARAQCQQSPSSAGRALHQQSSAVCARCPICASSHPAPLQGSRHTCCADAS